MRRHPFASFIVPVLIGVCGLLLPPATSGQQKVVVAKTPGKAKKTAPVILDFNAALALSFDSLKELGQRIRTARAAYDPVSLASVSAELAVAEKVSGKKASLTADALRDEAVELAELRFDPMELKAVALLINMPELNAIARRAEQTAALEKAAVARGEKTRGMRSLEVTNETSDTIAIIVDGKRKGSVSPGKMRTFDDVRHTNGQPVVLLHAIDPEGRRVAELAVPGELGKYPWTVKDE